MNRPPPRSTLFPYTTLSRSSSRLPRGVVAYVSDDEALALAACKEAERLTSSDRGFRALCYPPRTSRPLSGGSRRSEEHTSELQSLRHLVCRLLLEKKKKLST